MIFEAYNCLVLNIEVFIFYLVYGHPSQRSHWLRVTLAKEKKLQLSIRAVISSSFMSPRPGIMNLVLFFIHCKNCVLREQPREPHQTQTKFGVTEHGGLGGNWGQGGGGVGVAKQGPRLGVLGGVCGRKGECDGGEGR